MSNWEKHYEQRKLSAEEAVSMIRPNQRILLAGSCNEPQTLAEQLVARKERLQGVVIYTMIQGSPCLYARKDCIPYFKIRAFLPSPTVKHAIQYGDFDYIPINLSKVPDWISQQGGTDFVMIQVTPPDPAGYCSLGTSVDFMKAAVRHGKTVIAQVNGELPWIYGETRIHVTEIDYFVLSNRPILEVPGKPLTEVEQRIGEHVASIIPDRATIQVGIGGIADGVLASLKGKRDLGIHTGTFTDKIIELIEQGVVTNEHKKINKGKVVSTSIAGTKKLYDYVNRNDRFELHPVDYTHNVHILSQIDLFYSVNSAIEVDLTGQVNAEMVNSLQVAGVGGQMDFIRGSQASPGGKAIIALPSTAKDGAISRIVSRSSHVTSLRTEIDFIVTEYGVAHITGKTLKERAAEIISVAHPNFRDELERRGNHWQAQRN